MATTAFLLHPAASLHDTGWGHPEHQGRLRALASSVGRDMLALHGHVEQVPVPESMEAPEEALLRVHTPEHLERVRSAVERAHAERTVITLDEDTRVSSASWSAALGSLGAALRAAGDVAAGRYDNAFVAARPPGHHATPDRAMGFCLFNTAAVTARWLQDQGLAERVLIVDWDVHHGNGTQDVFWTDPSVFYLSLHQWPSWPGTGAARERGEGRGEGTTLNVPLAPGTSRAEYRARFEQALEPVVADFRPDFVLVSSGFDALAGDPLAAQSLEPEDFHGLVRTLLDRTGVHADGRVVALLEGGYDPARTGLAAVATLRGLAGVTPADPTLPADAG